MNVDRMQGQLAGETLEARFESFVERLRDLETLFFPKLKRADSELYEEIESVMEGSKKLPARTDRERLACIPRTFHLCSTTFLPKRRARSGRLKWRRRR